MITSIQKWGNSQGVRLSKNILSIAGFPETGAVKIVAEPDRIIIQKVGKRKYQTLQELFEGYDGDCQCSEWDTGSPVGKEVV